MAEPFDLVILGAGSGGYAAALRAAQLGLKVALVERDKVGGTCLHRGCIPTKAMLHAAEIADSARDGLSFGVRSNFHGVDSAAVTAYADGVVKRLYRGLTDLIRAREITVVKGEGQLVRTETGVAAQVEDQLYAAPYVILATGSYSRTLPGVAVDGTRVLTSEHALRLPHLPKSAIVLGGGVIGVEFASAWRSFGVEVTIIEALPRLVPQEEPTVSAALQRAFRKRKITVRTDCALTECSVDDSGVKVSLADGGQVEAEVLLVAVGRGPATDDLGYAEAGVELNRGFVEVDQRLQTSVPGVYAVGDIVLGLQLAHRGFAHGIFVAEEAAYRLGRLDQAPTPVVDTTIPRVTYCDPEIGSVGLTEDQARSQYSEIETLTYDLAGNGKSQILRTQGFVKLVRVGDGPVVGIHLIGARASELIAEAQLITGWDAFPSDVASFVHAHPTMGEAMGEAHLALAGKPLHTHP